MSAGLILGNFHDDDELPPIVIDMSAVTAAAVAKRKWFLEFSCHGAPFNWRGEAPSESLAEAKARAELSDNRADFNRYNARLVACIEG